MLINKLQQLGFHKNEAVVYLTLLELGQCRAGSIIEHSKLHRNLVYTALEALEKRNLVSKITVGKVFQFSANTPDRILEELENKKQTVKDLINDLKKQQKEESREIGTYEGLEGVKTVRNRTLYGENIGETLYVMGGSKFSTTPELENYWRRYHKKREQQGINFKILFDRNTPKEFLNWRNNLALSEAKYFPFSADMPVQISWFKEMIDISMPGATPLIFTFKSAEIASGLKKYFEYFWSQKVYMESGMDALKTVFYDMLEELQPGEEYCVFGTALGKNEKYRNFFDEYHRTRIKKGVILKMLSYREDMSEIKERFFVKGGDPEGKVSFIKPFVSAPPVPMQITMYKGKTRMLFSGDEPIVFYFEQPEFYQGFKQYFDEIWNQETQILKGAKALQEIWLEAIDCKELRFIGARGYFVDRYPDLFKVVKEKAERTPGVKWFNIVDKGVRGHAITKFPWVKTKYNISNIKNPNVIWLYGGKVVIANWVGDEPVMFVSTNKQLVQSQNDYFEELWEKGE